MAESIMIMGTSSHVGKSILCTALCRIFYRRGVSVVPFKAQNMALNSYVTSEGLEMGRAQVAQAEAAGLAPFVDMNPVLLKPSGDSTSQVIIDGRPAGTFSARDYHQNYSQHAFPHVKAALDRLDQNFDLIVAEGAGSPAEVNLKANDIVNMRVAKYLQAPVLLTADVDRGGALAAVVGTLELLEPEEKDLVKGIIINKFRGDFSLFSDAAIFLEKKTGLPVLGVIPYIPQIHIDEEDSVSLEKKSSVKSAREDTLSLAVIKLPHLSNFTDFTALEDEPDVRLSYVETQEALRRADPDLILLPGTKNTTEDFGFLEVSGISSEIVSAASRGVPIIGICGGYQMLGKELLDPFHEEAEESYRKGLGLLDIQTTFLPAEEKYTRQVEAECPGIPFAGGILSGAHLRGYEIHAGRTSILSNEYSSAPFLVHEGAESSVLRQEGAASSQLDVFGSYLHGLFDNDTFRRSLLNLLRNKKGWKKLPIQFNLWRKKQDAYEHLADVVEAHLDMDRVVSIIKESAHHRRRRKGME